MFSPPNLSLLDIGAAEVFPRQKAGTVGTNRLSGVFANQKLFLREKHPAFAAAFIGHDGSPLFDFI
jgi:hypothetical protein